MSGTSPEQSRTATNRLERRKQHTRAALKQACAELLLTRGYDDLTVQAITDHADLGYGTFYLHFRDRDAIVWEVIHDDSQRFSRALDEALRPYGYPLREFLSWIAIFRRTEAYREPYKRMFGTRGSAILNHALQDYLAGLHEENLRAGNYSSGTELPPDFLANLMTGAVVRLMTWWVETPNDYTVEVMATMLFEAIFRQSLPPDWLDLARTFALSET